MLFRSYCGNLVSSDRGWSRSSPPLQPAIHVCSHCDSPSYFGVGGQVPGVVPGAEIKHLPSGIEALYREARKAVSADAATAAVLACRKLLMHVAVEQGAEAGSSFVAYVDFLADKGFVPPNGRGWVDHIRLKSNEANHEIVLMSSEEATDLIAFAEMLLKFIYEFPNRVPKAKSP